VRIRYFGFLANRVRVGKLARIRALLAVPPATAPAPPPSPPTAEAIATPPEPLRCPRCGVGVLVFVELVLPGGYIPSIPPPAPMDTS
jgi:hypothetical protein